MKKGRLAARSQQPEGAAEQHVRTADAEEVKCRNYSMFGKVAFRRMIIAVV